MLDITSGKLRRPQKVVIYGPEGIGKTTFAASFPDPVFIDTEGSTYHMDVKRVKKPDSWTELLTMVKQFSKSPGICKTLVLDTADWAEQLCADELCAQFQRNGIEDFGYGKGYTYLQEKFGKLLNGLEEVVNAGMNVVITAHAKMRKFEQPDEMGAYDRWEMKLTKQVAPLVKEWADMVLFANYKTYVVATDEKGKKHKAQGGKRVLHTSHHPCWDAKNRHGLPEELPLDYAQIAHCIEQEGNEQKQSCPSYTQQAAEKSPDPETAAESEKTTAQSNTAADSEYVQCKLPPTPEQIPINVLALMQASGISEEEVRDVFAIKGYYPVDTPWSVLEEEGFVAGWIIPQWDNIVSMAMIERDKLPF